MIRVLNIILAVACVLALIGVYGLKFQSEGVASRKLALKAEISDQQNQLSLLRANWAYVSQPGYLQPIIARHAADLNLAIIGAKQFKSVDDLPMRPAKLDPDALTTLLQSLEAGIDPIAALIEAN
jgi:hypothetical protein